MGASKMADRTVLTGRVQAGRSLYLRARADNANDERRVFYKAMLDHQTYEAYLDAVGGMKVFAPMFGRGEEPIRRCERGDQRAGNASG